MSEIRELLTELNQEKAIGNILWKIDTLQLVENSWDFSEQLIIFICDDSTPEPIRQQSFKTAKELVYLVSPITDVEILIKDVKNGSKESLSLLSKFIAYGCNRQKHLDRKQAEEWRNSRILK